MEKLAGPVRGKNGAVLLYHVTGTDMLEHRFRPKSLVLLKTSVEQIPVYIGKKNSDPVSFKVIFQGNRSNCRVIKIKVVIYGYSHC